jgi:hypothetical protein
MMNLPGLFRRSPLQKPGESNSTGIKKCVLANDSLLVAFRDLVSYPKQACQGHKPFYYSVQLAAVFNPHPQCKRKKNAHRRNPPKSVLITNCRQPGSLSPIGFRPMALRRHLSVTLPLQLIKLSYKTIY